jgi:syntaxin 16
VVCQQHYSSDIFAGLFADKVAIEDGSRLSVCLTGVRLAFICSSAFLRAILEQELNMATRDRTALFMRYREESCALHGDSARRPAPHGSKSPLGFRSRYGRQDDQLSSLPPPVSLTRTGSAGSDWLRTYHDLVDDVAEAQACLDSLTALYTKHLLPSFGYDDQRGLEHDIQVGAQELTRMLQNADSKVKRIADNQGISGGTPDEHSVVLRNIQRRFAGQVQQLSLTFRKKQKAYMSELEGQREAVGCKSAKRERQDGDNFFVDVRDDVRGWGDSSDSQVLLEDDGRDLTAERNREITSIAVSINDLATIVKDLATLVVDQGTVLDRVDYNIENARSDTQGAVKQLNIADRYQRKRHAFCCILFLALGCGFMAVVLLYRWLS